MRFGLIGLALLLVAAPSGAGQPTTKVSQIGWLCSHSAATMRGIEPFVDALRARGYDEGRNIRIERRYADENYDRLAELAADLVRFRVDVIVACDSRAIAPARKATSTIPIVMAVSGDPVGLGHIASLPRPGGNVTGLSNMSPELAGKRLELLRELLPSLSRVAVLGPPGIVAEWKEMKVASDRLQMELLALYVSRPEDLPGAFSMADKRKAGALIVLPSPVTNFHAREIVELATRAKLPALYPVRDYAAVGGLMSYGPSIPDLYRRAAYYVDRILKGAKPSELPVEQPTKFEFVINTKTAKALGIKVPTSLLVQAQTVVE